MSAATTTAYWNPKVETLPKDRLRALQLVRLQRLVDRAWHTSPFHRRLYQGAGVTPDKIRSLDDLRRLPFMTREDWMANQAEKPLFGDLITRPETEAIRYHLTSGTSGRQPLRVLDSRKDWSWIADMWCYGFWAFGVRPTDKVFFAFSHAARSSASGARTTAAKARLPDAGVGQHDDRAARRSRSSRWARPSSARRRPTRCAWARPPRRWASTCAATAVRRVVVSGEPAGSIPAVKKMIEEMGWQVRRHRRHDRDRHDHDLRVRPPARRPAHHRRPLHRGGARPGDRRARRLRRTRRTRRDVVRPRLHPLLRYRTKDLVCKVPHTRCTCGAPATSTRAASSAASTT
ncbi:MAG: hypothetical protein U1E73_04035 [Planctomycetota bacterium]